MLLKTLIMEHLFLEGKKSGLYKSKNMYVLRQIIKSWYWCFSPVCNVYVSSPTWRSCDADQVEESYFILYLGARLTLLLRTYGMQ